MSDKITGIICGPRLYEFDGWFFEINAACGPWPLKKDGELRERAGRVFWKVWNRFDAMPKDEQEKFRVGGGCHNF